MYKRQECNTDSQIKDVSIKVGGNPAKPDNDWSYMAPFSPSDVIEEYTRPARIIENGKIKIVEPITDLHSINVSNFGMMEAFLTDGLRSLLDSRMAKNMREYTVRWPGHIQKWIASKDSLTDEELIESWKFDHTRNEFTWMEIKISYDEYQVIWEIVDEGLDGASSMARTTGLVTIACAIDLLESSTNEFKWFDSGVLAPENLGIKSIDKVIKYMRSEKVTINRTVTK